jgi:putative DNA primase/helicase
MSSKEEKPDREFDGIPNNYKCTNGGVRRIVEDGEPELITMKPVLVKALSRDESGDNWGVLVWWIDLDEKEHEKAIPKKLFHAQGTELAQLLADGGLQIVPGKEKALLRYLAAFNVEDKLIAASCTGWLGESFVLPTGSINEPKGQRIVYQPSGLSNTAKAISKKGSLLDWQSGMANASPMIIFFTCASLSAPVRYKAGIEAGGFHAYNLTSQGKTTMLQAASSVWGNGVDPAIAGGDEAYIQRWNATANALEAKAETFNDLAMIIDEIGEGDPREFGRTIYRVISGTGRGRANRSGGLRDSKSWRVTILSAGEVAVSDFIESGGGKIKGGQMVRMVDLDLAVIGKLFDTADEANTMKKLCADHYGHVGPAMLQAIPDLASGWSEFDQSIIGETFTAIASRVRARFALVAYTGVMAAQVGVLPWTEDQIIDATKSAYAAWHDRVNVVSDVDRGVIAVRDFILKNESRFEAPGSNQIPHDRAGWYRDDMYHFTPAAIKEACDGVDASKVKRALKESGLLHSNKSTGYGSNITVNGKATGVTSIKSEIFSDPHPSGGIGGIGGNSPYKQRGSADTTSGIEVVSMVSGSEANATSDTADTTKGNEVVSPESLINKGAIPPIPPIPPKSEKKTFAEEF